MHLKKRGIYVVFMLALLPVAAYAQTSLYGPASGRLGGGLEIRSPKEGNPFLMGNLGIGFNNGNSRISVLGGWSSYEYTVTYESSLFRGVTDTYNVSELLYIGGIEGIHLYPLEETGFEVYSRVEFTVFYPAGGPADIPTVFVGALGLSKHLETGNGGLKPSLGLIYQRLDVVSGSETIDLYRGFAGEAGLEYNISWFSILGAARFSVPFDSSETVYKIGVNFFCETIYHVRVCTHCAVSARGNVVGTCA